MSQLPEKIRHLKPPFRVVATYGLARRFEQQHGLKPKDTRVIIHRHDMCGHSGPVIILPAGERNSDVMREVELRRIWTKVEKIRAKQAAKPKHSPLPQ